MGKKALGIRSIEADAVLSHPDITRWPDYTMSLPKSNMLQLYGLQSTMLDRDTCEKDLSWLQWLVYIRVSFERRVENNVEQFVFFYQRGKAGAEDRLHDLWSMGLGGHVEDEPTPAKSTLQVLAESAQRELVEEIGIDLDINVFYKALLEPIIIRDTTDPREAVHLGLFIDVRVDESQINGEHESNVISNGSWVKLSEIQQQHAEGTRQLEPWSKAFARIPLPSAHHFADLAS